MIIGMQRHTKTAPAMAREKNNNKATAMNKKPIVMVLDLLLTCSVRCGESGIEDVLLTLEQAAGRGTGLGRTFYDQTHGSRGYLH